MAHASSGRSTAGSATMQTGGPSLSAPFAGHRIPESARVGLCRAAAPAQMSMWKRSSKARKTMFTGTALLAFLWIYNSTSWKQRQLAKELLYNENDLWESRSAHHESPPERSSAADQSQYVAGSIRESYKSRGSQQEHTIDNAPLSDSHDARQDVDTPPDSSNPSSRHEESGSAGTPSGFDPWKSELPQRVAGDGQNNAQVGQNVTDVKYESEKSIETDVKSEDNKLDQTFHGDSRHRNNQPSNQADGSTEAANAVDVGPIPQDSEGVQSTPSASTKISMVVIFHNEYETLASSLKSWEAGGLLDAVDDVVFFLNEAASTDRFQEEVSTTTQDWGSKARVISSTENILLGRAIAKAVESAKHDNILLVEKDWALVQPANVTREALRLAVSMVTQKQAHVVRQRHRSRPGAPLHAQIMHQGREWSMEKEQSNLMCNLHHWQKDPVSSHPEVFSKCPGHENEPDLVCSTARYCQWTNNPSVFSRTWFLTELAAPYLEKARALENDQPDTNMLDFEFYMNWQLDVWNMRNYTVALPEGLFEHREIGEQNLMNTVWYAWYRLSTEVEDYRHQYLKSRLQDQSASGAATPAVDYSIRDVYPVEFVRRYHYEHAMLRTEAEAVDELTKEASQLSEQLDRNEGTWRHGVTALTNMYYRSVLYNYPVEPANMNIIFVSSVFTSNRTSASVVDAKLRMAAQNLGSLSAYDRVVFSTPALGERLRKLLPSTNDSSTNIHIIELSPDTLIENVFSQTSYTHVESITREKCIKRRGERCDAFNIAAKLSKPLLLRHSLNVEAVKHGSHFLWIDALTPCLSALQTDILETIEDDDQTDLVTEITPMNDAIIRAHMLLKIFATWRMEPHTTTAIHMPTRELDEMLELNEVDTKRGFPLVEADLFGGSRTAVALLAGYYNVVLKDILNRGFLPTVREPLSVVMRNVAYTFSGFRTDTACKRNIRGDHACNGTPRVTQGIRDVRSCRVFDWAMSTPFASSDKGDSSGQ